MILIENLKNNEIRNIIDEIYFLNLEDRITIDALIHYTFIFYENIKDISNDEIETARRFATQLVNKYKNSKDYYKYYEDNFKKFVNQQIFKGITKYDYDSLKNDICKKINCFKEGLNNSWWNYGIYYDVNYADNIILINRDIPLTNKPDKIIYNINKRTVTVDNSFKITNDAVLLDELTKSSLIIDNDYIKDMGM